MYEDPCWWCRLGLHWACERGALVPEHAESVAENTWRFTMENPCTCPPRPSTDECPRVEECYQAWCEATLIDGSPDA